MLGNQEAFEIITAHLRKQKTQAVNLQGKCIYLNSSGAMCAVGCLIQGIELTPDQNQSSVRDLYIDNLAVQALFKEVDLDLLEEMQSLHDNAGYYDRTGFTVSGETKLNQIATGYHLNVPERP